MDIKKRNINLLFILGVLTYISCQVHEKNKLKADKITIDQHGAIIRGDKSRKELALVFTGDEFADGGEVIRNSLNKQNVKAAFFLTGNFYQNPEF